MSVSITSQVQSLLDEFKLPANDIGFGKVLAPVMMKATYKQGNWSKLEVVPYENINLSPTTKVLHYGQEIFEGLKAYNYKGNGPNLFRPIENAKRFNFSASRMGMPEIPEQLFINAVKTLTNLCKPFIPTNSGDSLYIRPFMYATDEHLGIKPSESFSFLVLASPSGSYFNSGTIKALIERQYVRAFPGGTGNAKTGGNYAASLKASQKSWSLGYEQTLWLDAIHREYIEEMSGMNFFAVIGGELYTPEITDTILEGITRKSIIELAKHKGLKVHETKMSIKDLIKEFEQSNVNELFACGTAVIITPIGAIGEEDKTQYLVKDTDFPVSLGLRADLLDIQEGRCADPFGWIV